MSCDCNCEDGGGCEDESVDEDGDINDGVEVPSDDCGANFRISKCTVCDHEWL